MSDSKENVEASLINENQRRSFFELISQGFSIDLAEFQRQFRIMTALSNGSSAVPKASHETRIHVDRISQDKAQQRLKEAERKAQIEIGNWSENESTMTLGDVDNPTLEATFQNLAKRYVIFITLDARKVEIESYLYDKPIALRSFKYYWVINDAYKRWLSFWWLAANDASQEICKISTVKTRLAQFVYALEDTLRNGNRDKKGIDNGLAADTNPSCGHGFYNKFGEAFFGLHPDNVFIGRIKPMMAELTKKIARAVYINQSSNGDRKVLYEAIQACRSYIANSLQRDLVDRFLSHVYGALDLEIKRTFGDHEKLFSPLLQEYAATAEWVEIPAPEEADKLVAASDIIPALTPQEIEALRLSQIKTLQEILETISERYQCPIDSRFPANPVRVQRHPSGKELLLQVFGSERLKELNVCPLSRYVLNLGQKRLVQVPMKSDELKEHLEEYGEHGPLVCAKKEMIFFAVAANDYLQQAASLIETLDKDHQDNINEFKIELEVLLAKVENLELKNNAQIILQKLQNGQREAVSKLELSEADITLLKPLWSSKLDPSLGLSQGANKRNVERAHNAASASTQSHNPILDRDLDLLASAGSGDFVAPLIMSNNRFGNLDRRSNQRSERPEGYSRAMQAQGFPRNGNGPALQVQAPPVQAQPVAAPVTQNAMLSRRF